MKLRFVTVLLLCLPFAIFGSQPSAAGGCGWDYPCAPEPSFGRPGYRSGQVTIHNYGNVNIYTSRRPGPPPFPVDPGFNPGACQDDACRYGCGGYPCTSKCGPLCWMRRLRQGYCGHGCQSYIEHARIEAEERAEWKEEHEGWERPRPPSDEWMYEKRTECAPPYCPPDYDAPHSPPPETYYYRRAPERYYDAPPFPPREEPSQLDLTPRGRLQSPAYPPK